MSAHDYSLNETASRARLAAKGIGYSWGQAEEVARSIFWLSRRQVPAMELLVKLFSHVQSAEGVALATPQEINDKQVANYAWMCPIISGCALSDWHQSIGTDKEIVISHLKVPFLMVPFIAELAKRSGQVLALAFEHETVATDGELVQCSDNTLMMLDQAANVVCRVATASEFDPSVAKVVVYHDRVEIAQKHWCKLGEYAHNTYAPATEASRLSGAGAGVTDND